MHFKDEKNSLCPVQRRLPKIPLKTPHDRATPRRLRVAMVCDFFFPQEGGIEIHIYQVAQQLIALGHHVIVITHAYGERKGVRYLDCGLKVYYVPFMTVYRESAFPTAFSFLPHFRQIVVRENIDVVHGHGSMSTFCQEAIVHGRTMGLATVFTDHSLVGFSNVGSILVNKLLKYSLTDADHVICVSHTCRENLVLRSALSPRKVSVIPNAVVSENFCPADSNSNSNSNSNSQFKCIDSSSISSAEDSGIVTVVVCSRLYANKGADLLVSAIPKICLMDPKINFIIAGNGPKIVDLQQMCERHLLQNRVNLLGAIRHNEVRDTMVKGQVYLHPTLTEAFGTVIVEAASCGLLVVTTNVGGIPEVLPEYMTVYAEPSTKDVVKSVLKAVEMVRTKEVDTTKFHDEVKRMYHWRDVAERTLGVYNKVLRKGMRSESIFMRMQRHYQCGIIVGKLYVLCVVVDTIALFVLDFLNPRHDIERVYGDWSTAVNKRVGDCI